MPIETKRDRLARTMRSTASSRFIAAARLERRDKLLTRLTAFTSAYVIVLTVLRYFLKKTAATTDLYNFVTVVLSIVILVSSLLGYSSGDVVNAERHHRSGLKINNLRRRSWTVFLLLALIFPLANEASASFWGENVIEPVDRSGLRSMAGGLGNLTVRIENRSFAEASAFAFILPDDASKAIYVAATAHQLYQLGNWQGPRLTDGGPDLAKIGFWSPGCKKTYWAKPSSFRVGSPYVAAKLQLPNGKQGPNLNRHLDFVVFEITPPICDELKPYVFTEVNEYKSSSLMQSLAKKRSMTVLGSYDPKVAVDLPPPPAGEVPVAAYGATCSLVGTEKIHLSTLLFHNCDTTLGGSGGPILLKQPDGSVGVIGIHRGNTDASMALQANEGILFNQDFRSLFLRKIPPLTRDGAN